MVWILTRYVLTAAFRDRLFLGFLLLLFVGVSLSFFLGSSAVTEKDQFSLIFAASGLRIGANLALLLFVVFYLRRAFESHDVEYLLSRPISKLQFLLSHFFAFSILALISAVFVTLVLIAMPSAGSEANFFLWGLSFWVELNIMVTIGLFFSLVLSSAVTAALASFAFYVLARLMGDILGILELTHQFGFSALLEKIMLFISIFIPRLDLMAQSSWLLYGVENSISWAFIFLQGGIFSAFVLAASFLDLNKRQF